jgi:hypothetical protein
MAADDARGLPGKRFSSRRQAAPEKMLRETVRDRPQQRNATIGRPATDRRT